MVSVRALVNDEFVMFLISACIRNLRSLVAGSLVYAHGVRTRSPLGLRTALLEQVPRGKFP